MHSQARYSFLLKIGGALLLVALADLLFWLQRGGTTIGLFALAMVVLTGCLRMEIFGSWPPRLAFAAAAFFALGLAGDPGPLKLLLFWTALSLAALLPRAQGFDHGLRWVLRLIVHGAVSPFGPLRDLMLAHKARRRSSSAGLTRRAVILIVPAIGSAIFIALFAQANPLIEQALARIDLHLEPNVETVIRLIFWSLILLAAWSLFRPTRFALAASGPAGDPELSLPGISLASVTLSLLAFNAIFALQNGLDLAFLWSGAALPEGMTLAEYAHRGAYPLIATALLAALFVLVTLRPGSATAASRTVRLLVTLWIAQNLLLVASTMLRTLDYIEAYSLTVLRISALIWMGLVAVGLILICYRLLRNRSAAWLINANLLAAFLTLAACTTIDLGRTAAAWNVRHARDVGGGGAELDICYLNELGPSALLPLIELESRPIPNDLRQRAAWLRSRILSDLEPYQADWHGWTPRNAYRLTLAHERIAALRLPIVPVPDRQCDGRPLPPRIAPLTAEQEAAAEAALEATDAAAPNETAPATNGAAPAPEAPKPLTGSPER